MPLPAPRPRRPAAGRGRRARRRAAPPHRRRPRGCALVLVQGVGVELVRVGGHPVGERTALDDPARIENSRKASCEAAMRSQVQSEGVRRGLEALEQTRAQQPGELQLEGLGDGRLEVLARAHSVPGAAPGSRPAQVVVLAARRRRSPRRGRSARRSRAARSRGRSRLVRTCGVGKRIGTSTPPMRTVSLG